MPSVKEFKTRLKSLKSTHKITSAMKVVAAAKLKRSKDVLEASKPFLKNFEEIFGELLSVKKNPLLKSVDGVNKTLYLVFSSNRGLCGSFNASIIKFFCNNVDVKKTDIIFSVGKKVKEGIKHAALIVDKSFEEIVNNPSFTEVEILSREVIELFLTGKISKVFVIYNKFQSTLKQTVTQTELLPIASSKREYINTHLIEVDDDYFKNEILFKKIAVELYQIFLHNAIGEHASRMTAMESATSNAKEIINKITIKMNRARQTSITTELTEIVSGAESLKN